MHLGFQSLDFKSRVRTRGELQIEGQAVDFKFRRRNGAGNRFGNESAERLGKARQLRRLQAIAFVQADTTQRAAINASQSCLLYWLPYYGCFGPQLRLVVLAR